MNEAIELFGPFACDAVLAPVLREILRSRWIEERKGLGETSDDLKLGWAQEFYDWKCVAKKESGSTVFARDRRCFTEGETAHGNGIVTNILDKMRWCGYTPWSAVQALRCSEVRVDAIDCLECKRRLLASCVYLMECAAVEASRQGDWLVRNEAVIQLCWVLYQIHEPQGCRAEESLEAWTESVVLHSLSFQEDKAEGRPSDLETLVVMYANDHLPVASETTAGHAARTGEERASDQAPDSALLEVVACNDRFSSPKREPVIVRSSAKRGVFNVSTVPVDVLTEPVGGATEARGQEVDVIARALVLCFPRVAASALDGLTLNAPESGKCSGRIWPVFVNATRSCYHLYKALALPVSPSPMYTLELLARAWRRVNPEALERFIPTSTGGVLEVSSDHYAKHLAGPVGTLSDLGLISELERNLTLKALSQGVLPCFAGEGDSAPDRLVSSTVALTFAACGLRVFGEFDERDRESGECRAVTAAGLLYFAAWYVLVYAASVHTQPTLKDKLSRTGSDADKHVCASLKREWGAEGSAPDYDFVVRQIARALGVVFRDLLETRTVLRVAELYVPELLAQLPYAKKLNRIPGTVKTAIESRDAWFAERRGERDDPHPEGDETPFVYLGNLAHGLHSSIEGTLTRSYARPIAQAPRGPDGEFDPWCDTLYVLKEAHDEDDDDDDDDHHHHHQHHHHRDDDDRGDDHDDLDDDDDVEDALRLSLEHNSQEIFYDPDECDLKRPSEENRPSSGREGYAPEALESPEDVDYRRICKGLLVNVHKLGFDAGHGFLTETHGSDYAADKTRGVSAPVVKTPCLTNIASTLYTKTRREAEVRYRNPTSFDTLAEALWVLFMHRASHSEREAPSSTASASETEPATPEALAVMVHLAVKCLKHHDTGITFGVCNDLKKMYTETCHGEVEFLPFAAIAGGLFGANVELNVDGYHYRIFNEHYRGLRAPGSLFYNEGVWNVIAEGVDHSVVQVPHEKPTVCCYHDGTLGAYVRLNDLKVVKVQSDNYCGFHTVAVLLGLIVGDGESTFIHASSRDLRERLALETSKYMTLNKRMQEIRTYLELNKIESQRDLTNLLMTPNRWLSTEEISFMLQAHGSPSAVITDNSYPIYTAGCSHFLIKACHYEPVMPT